MNSHSRKIGTLAICIVVVLSLAIPGFGQNRILKGKVTNEKGEPIVDAQVTIEGMDIKRHYKVNTNKKGEYFYMGIPYGVYRIVVRAEGYLSDYAQGVRSSVSRETSTDFTLKIGESTQKMAFEIDPEELAKLKKRAAQAEKEKGVTDDVRALNDSGFALAQEGKYAEAIVEYNKALEKAPDEPAVIINLAVALSNNNQLQESVAAYQRAITFRPTDTALYMNMGSALSKLGKTAEAREAYQKAASVNPASAGKSFYNLGVTLVNSGKTAEAVEAFKQSIAADPNYAESYYQLGICLSGDTASIPEAVEALQKYTEIGTNAELVDVAKQLIAALKPNR